MTSFPKPLLHKALGLCILVFLSGLFFSLLSSRKWILKGLFCSPEGLQKITTCIIAIRLIACGIDEIFCVYSKTAGDFSVEHLELKKLSRQIFYVWTIDTPGLQHDFNLLQRTLNSVQDQRTLSDPLIDFLSSYPFRNVRTSYLIVSLKVHTLISH